MVRAVKQNVVVEPGGILRIQRDDLPEGATVEVIVMIQQPHVDTAAHTGFSRFWGSARGTFGTKEEIDAYIERERSSWD